MTLPAMAALFCLAAAPLFPQGKPPSDTSADPEAERQLMQLADGFEIQLVASEPTIVNPLSMNFDPHRRLWVLCAPRYPQDRQRDGRVAYHMFTCSAVSDQYLA